MSLLLHGTGTFALTGRLEIELQAPAAVGTFVEVEADVVETQGTRVMLSASARGEDGPIATARGTFVEVPGA
jgi:acyl-coenzyme A thioesterase PaaI-like protein